MGLLPHFDFNISFDKKITAQYQYKKQRKTLSKTKFIQQIYFNPFLPNVLFLYPLKTSEKDIFFDVPRGYKMGTLGRQVLIIILS